MQVVRVPCAPRVGYLLVRGEEEESRYVGFSTTTRILALWTRLGLPTKMIMEMKIHNVLHINILIVRETTSAGRIQVQVWTRLGLLSTVKTHNFFHIHLLLPYRVTEMYPTPHL